MAWETYKVETQRLQLINSYLNKEFTMVHLCKLYNISTKTAYKWVNRYLDEGELGLIDKSRAPLNPVHIYTQDQLDRAIDVKLQHRRRGPKKILAKLKDLYPDENWPCHTRLYEIFKEHHLVTKRRFKNKLATTSPLGVLNGCNDTWSIDLKGWFMTQDNVKFEPLTITDNYSRYLIRSVYLKYHSVDYVWPILEEAFREYGLPNKLRSDNGPPFGSMGLGRLTRLSVNLIKAGVVPEWIRPGHPEENGRHERFHSTLHQEIATPPRETLALQIDAMDRFVEEYNFDRHHEALGMKTPGSCYSKSLREWDGVLRSPEYDIRVMDVRRVSSNGCIAALNKEHYIGKILVGEYIGLKTTTTDDLEIYYGPVFLGKLNQEGVVKPVIKNRRPKYIGDKQKKSV